MKDDDGVKRIEVLSLFNSNFSFAFACTLTCKIRRRSHSRQRIKVLSQFGEQIVPSSDELTLIVLGGGGVRGSCLLNKG